MIPGALKDDQLELWVVGAKVEGKRTNGNANLKGTVVKSTPDRLEIEMQESWKGNHPRWRWMFERISGDPETGGCQLRLVQMVRLSPGPKDHRQDFEGVSSLRGREIIGEAGFSWQSKKGRVRRAPSEPIDDLQLHLVD
ncbi:MAG: hypothetical protein RL885_32530 [Planctomycetota bacterium]